MGLVKKVGAWALLFSFLMSAAQLISVQPAAAVAGDGASSNVEIFDTDDNGMIDRITFDIANPNGETWQLVGAAPHGLSVTQGGNDITIFSVTITTLATANPVTIQVELNEVDPDLTVNTAVGTTELVYTQETGDQTCTVCINDSTDEELNTIATGDTGATDTEIDRAAPVFVSTGSNYRDQSNDATIDGVRLGFSETVTYAYNDADWTVTANGLTGLDITGCSTCSGSGFLLLNATANPNITGVSGGVEPQITYNAVSAISDGQGNDSLGFGPVFLSDFAKPVRLGAPTYADVDEDGTVDRMRIAMTEAVTYVYDNSEWTETANGLTGFTVVDCQSCANTSLLQLGITATQKLTGVSGGVEPSISFVGLIQDATGNLLTAVSASLQDDAPPIIKSFTYQDDDDDNKIDQFTVTFTEMVVGGSFLSANDLLLTNVGDFTGAAFGADATDLITVDVISVVVPLGTEASVEDTKEDSGTIAISTQNSFSLSDGLNTNENTGAQTQATFINGVPQGISARFRALREQEQLALQQQEADTQQQESSDQTGESESPTGGQPEPDQPESNEQETEQPEEPRFGSDVNDMPVRLGSLVKIANSSAVYYVDQNGVRHVFAGAAVYRSWYGEDFSRVVEVSPEVLAAMPLGRPVTFRPGTMIKIRTLPRVYVVLANREIRHIANESVARALFGDGWNTMIYDVDDAFFLEYREMPGDIENSDDIDLDALRSPDIRVNEQIVDVEIDS